MNPIKNPNLTLPALLLTIVSCLMNLVENGGKDMEKRFVWQTASPESQGMSATKLDALRDTLADRGTKTFLVIRHDKIVYEWYAPDYNSTKRHYTASLAKTLVGGTSLMLALNDGRIAVDDPAWEYIPAWKDHPKKSKITIRHLAWKQLSAAISHQILSLISLQWTITQIVQMR